MFYFNPGGTLFFKRASEVDNNMKFRSWPPWQRPKLSFNELQKVRKKMAMVFQFGALFDSMSIYENIKLAVDNLTDINDQDKKNRILNCLELVNLLDTKTLYPSDISGGMKSYK